jgi:hypothetical protein
LKAVAPAAAEMAICLNLPPRLRNREAVNLRVQVMRQQLQANDAWI